VKYLP
jgi:hypothetical protein